MSLPPSASSLAVVAGRRSWSWRVRFGLILLAMLAVPVAYLAAVAASGALLAEVAEPEPVDTILVLGGDGPARAEKASRLWRSGLARQAIVAGDGDCLHIKAAMVEAGVPSDAIAVECRSQNTWMNAVNSAALLETSHTRSALLVTSWFHTGRALRAFRLVCPAVHWIPAGTEPPPTLLEAATGHYGLAIAKEYFKVAGYRVREWLVPVGEPLPGHVCI